MKQQEISTLSTDDLKSQMESLSEKLMKMKLAHSVTPMENPLQIRHARRTVARMKTELTKREAQA